MTQLPNSVRSRLRAAAGSGVSPHPEANLLAAFSEQRLAGAEREEMLTHLAQCAECREVLALSMTLVQEKASPLAEDRGLFGWRLEFMRWGIVAASATVVVAAVFMASPDLKSPGGSGARGEAAAVKKPANEIAQSQALPVEKDSTKPAAADDAALRMKNEKRPAQAVAPQLAKESEAKALTPAPPQPSVRQGPGDLRADARDEPARGFAITAPTAERPARTSPKKKEHGNGAEPVAPRPQTKDAAAEYSLADLDEAKTKQDAESQNTVATGSLALKGKDEGKVPAVDGTAVMYESQGARKAAAPLAPARSRMELQPRTWRIREGKLESSLDAGKTWRRADAPGGAKFLAVDSRRASVWAGGTSGVVVRSDDNGATWVPVSTGWTGNVTYLKFDDDKRGILKTSTGEEWFTDDGGASWKKKN